MDYQELAEVYDKLESTSKRLEKTHTVYKFLLNTKTQDLETVIQLLQGKVFPPGDERVIGMSSKLLMKAIAKSTGATALQVEKLWSQKGDLGLASEKLTHNKKQSTLFSQKLTIKKVITNIKKLAEMTGEGTVNRKVDLVSELLTSATPLESRYICRTVIEGLRAGVGPGILRDAIVWAYLPKVTGIFFQCEKCEELNPKSKVCLSCGAKLDLKKELQDKNSVHIKEIKQLKNPENYKVIITDTESSSRDIYNHMLEVTQRAYDLTNDFVTVAITLKEKGFLALKKLNLQAGVPIKAMLYEKASNLDDAFKRVGTPAILEPKLDGFRIQIHRVKDTIKLFTRRFENVTNQFPDVEAEVKTNIRSRDYIADCEIVGIDPKTHHVKPFQHISQRIKRKYDIHKVAKELPVKVMLFDLMELNKENLLEKPFEERRKKLKAIVKEEKYKIELVKQMKTSNKEKANAYYQKSLDEGNEGVMIKSPNGTYKPGLRVSFGFGMKLKPTMETLDLVIVEAEWGEGKRAKWLSSFTLACRDSEGHMKTIGKVGTGVKEKAEEGISFGELTQELKKLIISEKGRTVKVKPKITLEIKYQEIQKSPKYGSGFALRFPRVVRLRTDRGPKDCSTLHEIKKFYNGQTFVSN